MNDQRDPKDNESQCGGAGGGLPRQAGGDAW
jgi:hypothetical protein